MPRPFRSITFSLLHAVKTATIKAVPEPKPHPAPPIPCWERPVGTFFQRCDASTQSGTVWELDDLDRANLALEAKPIVVGSHVKINVSSYFAQAKK